MAGQLKKSTTTSSAWGIILGLTGIPVVALFFKIFPDQRIVWDVLFGLFAVLAIKSFITYLFPRRAAAASHDDASDASHAH